MSQPAEEKSELCAICFTNRADHITVPCGHQCGCGPCLKRIKNSTGSCPICRNHFRDVVHVIRSGYQDSDEQKHVEPSAPKPPPASPAVPAASSPNKVIVDALAPSPDLVLRVSPASDNAEVDVLVTISAPDAADIRAPADICCVIDISGSMGTEATRQEAKDPNVRHSDGLSILDVVKHAVKAVVKSLEPQDRLAVVIFDQVAETVFALSFMDALGQQQALTAVDALRPRGQTNLWGGLLQGLEALRRGGVDNVRRKTVLLLTDGQPNIVPPKGHLEELRLYNEKHADFSVQIQTFGFGYNLDSALLFKLAQAGSGSNAFIPDGPIVGTVFIHSLANVLSNHTPKATLKLTPLNGAQFTGPIRGGFHVTDTPTDRIVNLGPIQLGQDRELVVPMRMPADAAAPFLSVSVDRGRGAPITIEAKERSVDGASLACQVASLRAAVIEACQDALAHPDVAIRDKMAPLLAKIDASPVSADERVVALRKDVAGRIAKALDGRDRFDRWGKHYLHGILRAHHLQQCTNFMDPGLQVYGGSLFSHLRSQGDRMYLSLPPPRPQVPLCPICHQAIDPALLSSHVDACMGGGGFPNADWGAPAKASGARSAAAGAAGGAAPPARPPSPPAPVDMNNYYDSSGGCFGELSSVLRICPVSRKGEKVPVSSVRAGDELLVADGTARVVCVVKVARMAGKCKPLIRLADGLKITSSHPVRVNGKWVRPDTLSTPDPTSLSDDGTWVYNFVLNRSHVLLLDGVECVTLGHGFVEPGVEHEYWGSRVLKDLCEHPGWSIGVVEVAGVLKDSSRRVVGLRAL